MTEARDLPARMRERADADQLAADHELRTLADALDQAIDAFFSAPPKITVRQFVAAWARARLVWCNLTGEPLI